MEKPIYKRIILKLSGEALAGKRGYGIDRDVLDLISDQVIGIQKMGVEVAIVVGGGNIWRGRSGVGMDRATADYMGMLATVINALALQDALENKDMQTRVQTAIEMRQIAEPYIRRRAIRHLEKGRVVIFACGTGNPIFQPIPLQRCEPLKLKQRLYYWQNIDGVYDDDPKINPAANKIDKISYINVLNQGLGVMDTTAISLCMDNKIPIIVFGLENHQNIKAAVLGRKVGTIIGEVC